MGNICNKKTDYPERTENIILLEKIVCDRYQADTYNIPVEENTLYDDADTYHALTALEIDMFQKLEILLYGKTSENIVSEIVSKDFAETLVKSRELQAKNIRVKITEVLSQTLTFYHNLPQNREICRITITKT